MGKLLWGDFVENRKEYLSENFTIQEARCKCNSPTCTALKRPPKRVVERLQMARNIYGKPMVITSWSRCALHNMAIGGALRSYHLKSIAVDIACADSRDRWKMVFALMQCGFTVVIYSDWIHADLRSDKPILLWGSQ